MSFGGGKNQQKEQNEQERVMASTTRALYCFVFMHGVVKRAVVYKDRTEMDAEKYQNANTYRSRPVMV